MCILAVSTSSKVSTDPIDISSMHSPQQNLSIDEQEELSSSEIDNVKTGNRPNTPSSITGNRSDVDSPIRSYALIETDSNELDRIIDILRQFFPNTRIVECNNSSSDQSRTPSRSSLSTAPPQQQTSIESTSSLRVPISTTNRYRSHSHSISEKSSFESDIFQNSITIPSETMNINLNDQLSSNTNSQVKINLLIRIYFFLFLFLFLFRHLKVK